MRLGWHLNLAAELELIDPEGRPSANLCRRVAAQGRRMLADARAAGGFDHVDLDERVDCDLAVAWCPTPSALARLRSLDRPFLPGPPAAVLRAVNHRRFAAEVSDDFPGSRFVEDADAAFRHLDGARPADGWLLKRPLGFSGRSRKRVGWPLTDAERRWIEASMTEHGCGLQIEPYVRILADYSVHGFLARGGTAIRGAVLEQEYGADGSFAGCRGRATGDRACAALQGAFELVATALATAGYFGPFSIDGFEYADPLGGGRRLRSISEVNARFTMTYFAGFARDPRELDRALRASVGTGEAP